MSNRRKPKLSDITAATTPAECTVPMCVSGAKFAEHQRLEEALDQAMVDEADRTPKINDVAESTKLAEKIRALEKSMEADTFDFSFRQIDAKRWRELKADSSPKPLQNWNPDTFPPVAVKVSCFEPDMSDGDQFDEFWAKLSAGQQDLLFGAALQVNERGTSVPFSASASALLKRSVPNSTSAASEGSLTPSS